MALEELRDRDVERIQKQYVPSERLQPGRPVPDFDFVSLDDPSVHYTRQGLLGTTYLINFWATWCGPCITKIGTLDRVYAAYKDRGFTILSVSINFREEKAHAFRRESTRCPG